MDGEWRKGEVRARRQNDDGDWGAWTTYSRGPAQNYNGTFSYDVIRLDEEEL